MIKNSWPLLGVGLLLLGLWSLPLKLARAQEEKTETTEEAATAETATTAQIDTSKLAKSINDLIENILRPIVLAGGTLIILWAGVMYILGSFNPDNTAAAKTILSTTVIGLIFMLLYPTIITTLADKGLIPPGIIVEKPAATGADGETSEEAE